MIINRAGWNRIGRILELTICPIARRLNVRRSHWPAAWCSMRATGNPLGSWRSLFTGGERP